MFCLHHEYSVYFHSSDVNLFILKHHIVYVPVFIHFSLTSLAFLIKEGYEDRIVIAHDIHTKNRLTKYGGHGYSHILKNIVPKMLFRGISQKQVDKILIDNPKQWLTFK